MMRLDHAEAIDADALFCQQRPRQRPALAQMRLRLARRFIGIFGIWPTVRLDGMKPARSRDGVKLCRVIMQFGV